MTCTEWERDKAMEERGINSPFQLTEFDQWVNDATRKDINAIVESDNTVFGLKLWEWEFIEAEKLKDSKNFSVDFIFKAGDRERVEELRDKYESGEIETRKLLDELFDMCVYYAIWV